MSSTSIGSLIAGDWMIVSSEADATESSTSIDDREILRTHIRNQLSRAFARLARVRTHQEVRAIRSWMFAHAGEVSFAVREELGSIQSPERATFLEALLVAGMNYEEAIRHARLSAFVTDQRSSVIEARAWAGVLAAFLENGEHLPDYAKYDLAAAIVALSENRDESVRLASVDALARVAEMCSDARDRLQKLSHDENAAVAAEARCAVDDLQ